MDYVLWGCFGFTVITVAVDVVRGTVRFVRRRNEKDDAEKWRKLREDLRKGGLS